MDLPKVFVSVRRFNCEKMNDMIKQLIPEETTIEGFMVKIGHLDNYLREKSTR